MLSKSRYHLQIKQILLLLCHYVTFIIDKQSDTQRITSGYLGNMYMLLRYYHYVTFMFTLCAYYCFLMLVNVAHTNCSGSWRCLHDVHTIYALAILRCC